MLLIQFITLDHEFCFKKKHKINLNQLANKTKIIYYIKMQKILRILYFINYLNSLIK